MFFCPICKEWQHGEPDHHHIFKGAVFGRIGKTIEICRSPCHNAVEEIIRLKENDILRQHPEIYQDTLNEFLDGKYNVFEIEKQIHKRRKERMYERMRR